MSAGLDGGPDAVAFDWTSVASYLDRLDGKSLNVATLVGNTPGRFAALWWGAEPRARRAGRGGNDGPAHAGARKSQRAVVREALQDGAFGLSSGLDYPPGAYATT